MNEDLSLLVQGLVVAIILFFLAINWGTLTSTVITCRRRDRDIVGQGLILTSIGIMGIFAFVNDQPGNPNFFESSNQMVFLIVILLISLWLLSARLVKKTMLKTAGQHSNIIISGTRYIVNFTGIISVVGCRFLLLKVL